MALSENQKQCPRCHQYLEKASFSKTKANKDGLSWYCRRCCSELREERLLRERDDPMAEERKFQKQLEKLYR